MEEQNKWKESWKNLLPEDIDRIIQQLSTQPLSLANGGIIKRFEKIYAKFAGTEYAVATNNGTAALYSALWAVDVGNGDEVMVCDYGFVAMAGAIVTLQAIMVPVDMDPNTFTMDPQDLKRKITSKTKAILVHNPWGVPADLDAIHLVTDLPIILDASHAHGVIYKDKPLASHADITCFSLGMGKLITGGELGCAVTSNPQYRDRMILLGHTNRTPFDLITKIWNGNNVGLKFRPHVLAMEIALLQMKRFEQKRTLLIATCKRIEQIFSEFGFIPQTAPQDAIRVYWRIVFVVDESYWEGLSTAEIESILKQVNLPVEPNHYWPLLQYQSPFLWDENKNFVRAEFCANSSKITPRLITLPAPVDLEEIQFDQIKSSLEKAKQFAKELKHV